jgi:hypothetical protein
VTSDDTDIVVEQLLYEDTVQRHDAVGLGGVGVLVPYDEASPAALLFPCYSLRRRSTCSLVVCPPS